MHLSLTRFAAVVPVAALLIAAPAVASADAHDTGRVTEGCTRATSAEIVVQGELSNALHDLSTAPGVIGPESDRALIAEIEAVLGLRAELAVAVELSALACAQPDDDVVTGPVTRGEVCTTPVGDVRALINASVLDDDLTNALDGLLDDDGDAPDTTSGLDIQVALNCDTVDGPPSPVGDDIDCADLTEEQAREILGADPRDPSRLDTDGDGVPCEEGELPDLDFDDLTDGEDFSQLGGRAPVGGVDTGA